MGVRVAVDWVADGMVLKENYPKYIIPYTPICIAVIVAMLLMPLLLKRWQSKALIGAGVVAVAVFFAAELLLERLVIITGEETVATLEDWQMFMCYVPVETIYKTQMAADILMGDYHPAFKLHFYMIAVVLILAVLNSLYGFGGMVYSENRRRLGSLVLQSVCGGLFLGLCILACFTAFWRDGTLKVSPLSAVLMIVFFVLLGVTFGVFVGSFLLGKRAAVSVAVPAVVAGVTTLLMYIGEMILLNGHVYEMGEGVLFDGLPMVVLAPMDVLVILASALLTAALFWRINRKADKS